MRNEKGFELIELMIVVIIMGILAAVAIPQFMKYNKPKQSNSLQQGVGTEQKVVDSFKCPKCSNEFSIVTKH